MIDRLHNTGSAGSPVEMLTEEMLIDILRKIAFVSSHL
jgi:hypothetical protein